MLITRIYRTIHLQQQCFCYKNFQVQKTVRNSGTFQRARKHSIDQTWFETLQTWMKPGRIPTVGDWKTIRQDVINGTNNYITEVNIDALILGKFTSEDNILAARSYIEYLKDEKIEVNFGTLGQIMKVYNLFKRNGGQLSDEEKNYIIGMYKEITGKHSVLDPTTCENLILGLVTTELWKDSLNLMEMINITCKPSSQTYSAIITKAFSEEENFDIGWKLLTEMVCYNRQTRCEIFIEYLKTISKTTSRSLFITKLEKLFKFWEEYDIVVSEIVIKKLPEILSEFDILNNVTTITTLGNCRNCKNKLSSVKLTSNEFKELQTNFLDRVIVRSDVFLKSNPEELESFRGFLKACSPFDCVIDGLNVSFAFGAKKSPQAYANNLYAVVRYFVEKQKKILIIGRKHMNGWPQRQMSYVRQNSKLFFTSNLSSDDPFILYAALHSGPKTDFLSRDLMRSHSFLLGPELRAIFRRWQQQHQYFLLAKTADNRALIKEPVKYSTNTHKIGNYWHITFKDKYQSTPADNFEIPSQWLCVKL